jgi:hypothetical protein
MGGGLMQLVAYGAQDIYLTCGSIYQNTEEYSEESPMESLMQLVASADQYQNETTELYRKNWQSSMSHVLEELRLLPPIESIPSFPGGIEYQNAKNEFQALTRNLMQ